MLISYCLLLEGSRRVILKYASRSSLCLLRRGNLLTLLLFLLIGCKLLAESARISRLRKFATVGRHFDIIVDLRFEGQLLFLLELLLSGLPEGERRIIVLALHALLVIKEPLMNISSTILPLMLYNLCLSHEVGLSHRIVRLALLGDKFGLEGAASLFGLLFQSALIFKPLLLLLLSLHHQVDSFLEGYGATVCRHKWRLLAVRREATVDEMRAASVHHAILHEFFLSEEHLAHWVLF